MLQRENALPFLTIIYLLMVGGCGGDRQMDPSSLVEDPRTYAIDALSEMDLNTWWQAYRNTDPELLGRIVDDAAKKRPDGLATHRQQLDTFIRHRIAPSYRSHMSGTSEGRAFILAEAEVRFANPPMTVWDPAGKFALLDYNSLPGEWKLVTRVGKGLVNPPAIGTQPFLRPEIIGESLRRLVKAYPKARAYQIRYQYHDGSDLKKICIEFSPDSHIVYQGYGDRFFTRDHASWEDLLNGRVDLANLKWDSPSEEEFGPPITHPPINIEY